MENDKPKWQICSECFRTFEVKESEAVKQGHHYFCDEHCKVLYNEFRPSIDAELA